MQPSLVSSGMRQTLPMFLLTAVFASTALRTAKTERDFYVQLEIGGSFSRYVEMIDGAVGTAAIFEGSIGYKFNEWFRSWLSFSSRERYKASGVESGIIVSGNLSAVTSMANIALELGQFGLLTPYVSGGVGISWNNSEISAQSIDGPKVLLPSNVSASFAWHASTGVGITISPQWGLDIGYRYFDSGTVRTVATENGSVQGKLRSHELRLAVVYHL